MVISKCACLLHVGHANVNIVVCLLCVAVYVGDDEFVYEEPHVQYSCDSPQELKHSTYCSLVVTLNFVLNRIEKVPRKSNVVKKVAVLPMVRWKIMRKGSLC